MESLQLQLAAGQLPDIAREAGRIIMEVRNSGDLDVKEKMTYDKPSPYTRADLLSHNYLYKKLGGLIPDVGVVSEECDEQENKKIITSQSTFWLMDPLDGTKSFIAGRESFAVNIALIDHGEPVLGAVYFPQQKILYYTGADGKAYKQKDGEDAVTIHSKKYEEGKSLTIITGFKDQEPEFKHMNIASLIGGSKIMQESNAKRICLMAEGLGDLTIGSSATSTWDTAGPDAVLRAAGSVLINTITKQPMTYGKDAVVHKDNQEYAFANPPYVGGQVALLEKLDMFSPATTLKSRRII